MQFSFDMMILFTVTNVKFLREAATDNYFFLLKHNKI